MGVRRRKEFVQVRPRHRSNIYRLGAVVEHSVVDVEYLASDVTQGMSEG
jgi:hypothetical protein